MRPPNKTSHKLISLLTLAAFALNLVISSPSYAELPCWNDGSKVNGMGGFNILPEAAQGNPNPQGAQKAADPVNLATGNYYYEHTEFSIPSRGMPLEFVRYYNNQDDYDGPFGIGSSHSYNIFLIEAADDEGGYVIRRNPDGNKDRFAKNSDGAYTAPKGVFDILTKESDGYSITTKHDLIYRFNTSGYLSSITDRNGNTTTLSYDPDSSVLLKITDCLNREVNLEYTPDKKILAITDFSGRRWEYEYLDGDLKYATSPPTAGFPAGLTTAYSYKNHNLSSITDARGNTYLDITYDNQDRVDRMVYGAGSYNFDYSKNLTTLFDRKGNRVDYCLNDDGTTQKKVEYTRAKNLETLYEYNSDKLITKVAYPKGNSVAYEYDPKGNLTKVVRKPPAGSLTFDIAAVFSYEPKYNFIKAATDPLGRTTAYNYDPRGNLQEIVYPEVNKEIPRAIFTYNPFGQVETATDPNLITTKYEYYLDSGYLKKVIADFGQERLNLATTYSYDTLGNPTSITDPKGNTTNFEYDSHNNLTKTTSSAPFNYITKYSYDENDNLKEVSRQTDDNDLPWQTTGYTYTILDEPKTITDPKGNTTAFDYDKNGNRSAITDALNNITNYEYNERNLLSKVTDAEGRAAEYAYDDNANLKELKDAKGNTTAYAYDDFDRLVKTTYPDNSYEEYAYDPASNLKTKKDPNGKTIYYDYDALNRLDLKAYPDTAAVDYVYDKGSRLTSVIANPPGFVAGEAISYSYDNLNRITGVTTQGKAVGYEYDPNSNRIRLTYPDASFVTYEYDALNRLTYIKDQLSQVIAHYSYDSLSRRTQAELANNTQAAYEYDAANRLLCLSSLRANAVSEAISYTYDKVGNRLSAVIARPPQAAEAITYTYDKTYQLTNADYPDNFAFPDAAYDYDFLGNLKTLSLRSAAGTEAISYASNFLNQYTTRTLSPEGGEGEGEGAIVYGYDLNGNLTNDGTNTYGYDYENRLTSVDYGLWTMDYLYDPFGRRITSSLRGASVASDEAISYLYDADQLICEYDSNNNLIAKYIYGPGIDEPVCKVVIASEPSPPQASEAIYFYHFDGLGSVTSLTNSTTQTIETYSYDAFGNPAIKDSSGNTIQSSSVGNRFLFTGREYDPESGLYFYRARHYSPTLGRFLQRDPIGYAGGVNLYSYVGNNPVNAVDPLGLYTLIIHGLNPIGQHKAGYSGEIGKTLQAAGETVKELIWSGRLLDFTAHNQVKNEIKQASEIATTRGEPLNIITHSWGGVLASSALRETRIRVDNFVTMGTPYFNFNRPAGVSRYLNIISRDDIAGWLSILNLTAKQFVSRTDLKNLLHIHNSYWNDPEAINTILKMFELDGGKKK